MKKLTWALAAAACAVFPQVAGAQIYGSLGYAQQDLERIDQELGAVQARVGWRANRFLSVEGEGAIGTNKESVTYNTVPPSSFSNKIKNQLAAYVVGVAPLNERVDLFARAGYGRTELRVTGDFNGTSYAYTTSENSWNYGFGGELRLTEKDGVRLDWTRHEFDDTGRADQVSISYQRRFR